MPRYCIGCGSQIPEVARFCGSCGQLQVAAEPTVAVTPPGGFDAPPAETPEPEQQSDLVELPTSSPAIDINQNQATEAYVEDVPLPTENILDVPAISGMGMRFLAFIADLIVIWFLYFVACFASGVIIAFSPGFKPVGDFLTDHPSISVYGMAFVYMIIALAIYHTTVGKYVFGLEVRSARAGEKYAGLARLMVRETVGRFVSQMLWGAGYWTARSHNGQAWSDRMADTNVVRIRTNKTIQTTLTISVAALLLVDFSMMIYGESVTDKKQRRETLTAQIGTETQAIENGRSEITRIQNQLDFNAPDYQTTLDSLSNAIDSEKKNLNEAKATITRYGAEDLYTSSEDQSQCEALLKAYDLRLKQMELLGAEAHDAAAVIYDPSPEHRQAVVARMRDSDSDIDGLDAQVDKILKDANLK